MAVLEKDVAVANFDATANISVAARTGAPAGVPIIVTICCNNRTRHANMVTIPTGFTLIHEEGLASSENVAWILKYRKDSSGSESGTYDWQLEVSTWGTIAAKWLEGADNTNPVDVVAGSNNGAGSESTAIAPSVTTTEDGSLIDRTFMDRAGATTLGGAGLDRTLWNAGERSACGVQDQATAGATGTNDATLSTAGRWAAVTVAYKPEQITARLLPKVLTNLAFSVGDLSIQTPADQDNEILIEPPPNEGAFLDERTLLVIHSRAYLPASAILAKPALSTDLVEANNPDATGASLIACLMPVGYVHADPEYIFGVDPAHVMSAPRIVAYSVRVRWLHAVTHLAATPQVSVLGGSQPDGDPDGLVRFLAITPDATALKSIRFCLGTARREGVWTLDANLTRVLPVSEEASYYIAGYELWDSILEAPERTAEHDSPLDPPNSYYGRTGLSLLLQGAADDGSPGAPNHAGTEAVSWASVKLVAAQDVTHPNAATSIEVYRHTVSMAGDPEINGTLIHTFSPDGTAVDADGWNPETTYFVQMVAKNASGSTIGFEFQVTTWRQAAYVLDTAQTMVVPMKVEEEGAVIAGSELRGSNVNSASWDYEHAGGMLLVFVSAHDPDGAASITGVTADAVSMEEKRNNTISPSGSTARLLGGTFVLGDVAAGTVTLALTTSGGSPEQRRWHAYSLNGPNIEVASSGFVAGQFDTEESSVAVFETNVEKGDLIIDHLTWLTSAIGIASIPEDQVPQLGDDSPTRQNGTSKVSPDGLGTTMRQTADDIAAANVRIHYAAVIRTTGGGGGPIMRAVQLDVGRAALNDSDLTTNPSLLVEAFDELAVKVGERTITDLSLLEGGVEEIVSTDELLAPQTAEVHLTNTGRTVAVWQLLGLEPGFVEHAAVVSDTAPMAVDSVTATFEEAPIPPPTDLTATAVEGPAIDLSWANADPTLQTRIYRRRIS